VRGEESILHKLSGRKKATLFNKNVLMFAFFLLIAFIFWYINSLGKEVRGEIRFTADFLNIPKGKEVSEDLPFRMTLELKGQGYALLKYKFSGQENKLNLDLTRISYRRIPETKPSRYYILTTALTQNIKKQLGNGFEIISVKPDTIFLTSSNN
jgi:hypothetical protein